MTDPYQRDIDQMRRDAKTAIEFQAPVCPRHYDLWWGVFARVAAEAPLVGYIRLRRNGNYALYAQLLGHAAHLGHGIMYRLHLAVMQWLLEHADPRTIGLEHLIYAGWESGGHGLQLWKKKMCFQPACLVLEEPPP